MHNLQALFLCIDYLLFLPGDLQYLSTMKLPQMGAPLPHYTYVLLPMSSC